MKQKNRTQTRFRSQVRTYLVHERHTTSSLTQGGTSSNWVDAVAQATGESKAMTGETLDALITAITGEVTKGGTVQLVGFGSFSTGARAARVGRNPATGAEIQIRPRRRSSSPRARHSRMR